MRRGFGLSQGVNTSNPAVKRERKGKNDLVYSFPNLRFVAPLPVELYLLKDFYKSFIPSKHRNQSKKSYTVIDEDFQKGWYV